MCDQPKAGGEEQGIALFRGDVGENPHESHSAWFSLKVRVCTFASVVFVLSLGSFVVYYHHYGEHKVLSTHVEEHSVRGPQFVAVKLHAAAIETGNAEMFVSQRPTSVQDSAVLKGEPRKKLHARSRAQMNSFLAIVEDLLHEDLLKLHHKTLCLDFHANKRVVALRARGFKDARGINLLPALMNPEHRHENSQIQKFAGQRFDFFFTSMFDYIPYPALFVAEIEETLKVGGLAAMHVSLNKWRNKYITGEPGCGIKPVTLLFQHSEIVYVSSAAAPGLDTIIVFKKTPQPKAVAVDQKEMKKEQQLQENPSMPQIRRETTQALFGPQLQEVCGGAAAV